MDNHNKLGIQMFFVISIYILLASLGIYTSVIFIVFPILNLPMIYYLVVSTNRKWQQLLMHVVIAISILLITGSVLQLIMYLIFVVATSYLIVYYYKNKYSIPHMIMYTGVILMGILYVLVGIMKSVGVDFIQEYMNLLAQYETLMLSQVDSILQGSPGLAEQVDLIKSTITLQVELMKLLYPAMFLTMGIGLVTINVATFSLLGKIKKWHIESFRQIAKFKFSKKMLILLIIAVLCAQIKSDMAFMMGSNLLLVVTTLLQIVGFITIIVQIKRSPMPLPIKLGVIILGVMLFYLLPSVLMIVGVFDTLFNFRKVEIIV